MLTCFLCDIQGLLISFKKCNWYPSINLNNSKIFQNMQVKSISIPCKKSFLIIHIHILHMNWIFFSFFFFYSFHYISNTRNITRLKSTKLSLLSITLKNVIDLLSITLKKCRWLQLITITYSKYIPSVMKVIAIILYFIYAHSPRLFLKNRGTFKDIWVNQLNFMISQLKGP